MGEDESYEYRYLGSGIQVSLFSDHVDEIPYLPYACLDSDIILIATATYPDKVPGGYRFLILGPLIDGCLGGFSTISATNHAYLSDTTPDGSRAKMFGRFQVSSRGAFLLLRWSGKADVAWRGCRGS